MGMQTSLVVGINVAFIAQCGPNMAYDLAHMSTQAKDRPESGAKYQDV